MLKAGAIGHTGAGNFGHGLHVCYKDVPGICLVAVADPDEAGRTEARERTGAERAYVDYGEMLAKEDLDVVSVCPRWVDRREEMVTACLEAGCHVYSEKPFAASLDSADRMIAAADRKALKVAVAHQGVYLPQVRRVRDWLKDGKIGRVVACHATGKQDRRGGGEDMLVLGTHLFNTMRFFEGDAAWVSGRVTQGGREIGPGDVRQAGEPIGWIAGDRVESLFAFASGAVGTFRSRRRDDSGSACYGLTIEGESGAIAVSGNASDVRVSAGAGAAPWNGGRVWCVPRIEMAPLSDGNRLAVEDLIACIGTNGEPVSSGKDARAALELILGTYASQISGARVPLPMQDRRHPLERFRAG